MSQSTQKQQAIDILLEEVLQQSMFTH